MNVQRLTVGMDNAKRHIDSMKDQELRDTYVFFRDLTTPETERTFHGLSFSDWRSLLDTEADRRGVK